MKPGRPKGTATPERLALNLRLPKGATEELEQLARESGLPVAAWLRVEIMKAIKRARVRR